MTNTATATHLNRLSGDLLRLTGETAETVTLETLESWDGNAGKVSTLDRRVAALTLVAWTGK